MLKDQLFKTSELQFDNCLFEPETGSRSIIWVMDPTNLLSRDTTCQGLQEIKITTILCAFSYLRVHHPQLVKGTSSIARPSNVKEFHLNVQQSQVMKQRSRFLSKEVHPIIFYFFQTLQVSPIPYWKAVTDFFLSNETKDDITRYLGTRRCWVHGLHFNRRKTLAKFC